MLFIKMMMITMMMILTKMMKDNYNGHDVPQIDDDDG